MDERSKTKLMPKSMANNTGCDLKRVVMMNEILASGFYIE